MVITVAKLETFLVRVPLHFFKKIIPTTFDEPNCSHFLMSSSLRRNESQCSAKFEEIELGKRFSKSH